MEDSIDLYNSSLCTDDLHANVSSKNISAFITCPFNFTFHLLNPFKEPLIRVTFIIVCIVIFLACVFGNMVVLLVTARNLRMQTRTNLLLANLAVADMCVGLFCVIPNMFNYLFLQWYLGKVMCKLYQFVESMSFTASMLLLEVIAIERYIAINHPLKAKRLFTRKKLFLVQLTVWFVSSLYNIPHLFIYDTVENQDNNVTSTFCYSSASFNVELYYVLTFVIWYLIPLFAMSLMYATIANTLWRSNLPLQMRPWNGSRANVSRTSSSQSAGTETQARRSPLSIKGAFGFSQSCNLTDTSMTGSCSSDISSIARGYQSEKTTPVKINNVYRVLFKKQKKASGRTTENVYCHTHYRVESPNKTEIDGSRSSCNNDLKVPGYLAPSSPDGSQNSTVSLCRNSSLKRELSFRNNMTTTNLDEEVASSVKSPTMARKQNPYPYCVHRMSLQKTSRRRVVKLLIVVLFTFAVLVLPNHVRLLMVYFHPFDIYWASSTGPICHILMYLNSAVNPILYSFFSESFRRSLKELVKCNRSRRQRAK